MVKATARLWAIAMATRVAVMNNVGNGNGNKGGRQYVRLMQGRQGGWGWQRGWRLSKRAIARADRVMAMKTKRVMAMATKRAMESNDHDHDHNNNNNR